MLHIYQFIHGKYTVFLIKFKFRYIHTIAHKINEKIIDVYDACEKLKKQSYT